MTRAAKSVFFFSFYMIIIGLFMIFFPIVTLRILNIGESASILVRFIGMVVIFMGYFYLRAGMNEGKFRPFYMLTLHTRFSAIVILILFVIFLKANPVIVVFGLIDFSGAIWTIVSMRGDKKLSEAESADMAANTDKDEPPKKD